ncbi:hypothetical protein M0R45_003962 [Rubus argutus]|uniref:Uncharacterized protein n=1 Tax=Rubus argutus TaxID=59490 RepID=A0AAW1YHR8_RUBAR
MASTANPFSISLSSKPPRKHHFLSPTTRRSFLFIMANSAQLVDQPPSKTGSAPPTIVEVDLGNRSYPIYIGSGLLDQPELLQRHVHGKRVLVVTNTTVAPLYLDKVVDALTRDNPNVSVESVILPDGEKYKDMDTLMKVFDKAIESRLDRRCTFVALGDSNNCYGTG